MRITGPLIMKARKIFRQAMRNRTAALVVFLPLLPTTALLLEDGAARGFLAIGLGALLLTTAFSAARLRRALVVAQNLAIAPQTLEPEHDITPAETGAIPQRKLRAFSRWEGRLHHGWSKSALPVLKKTADTKREHPEYRLKVMGSIADWHAASRRQGPPRTLDLDIVLVSNMNLQGGTTSSNEAEVLAFRAAGLKVGLLHHPVSDWNIARPMHPKLTALVDDQQVFQLQPSDTVQCDLRIVRFPTSMVELMEDLPDIKANSTVLVINQTPYEEYGFAGGYGRSWSIEAVHRNLSAWAGPHTWYPIGPAVRKVLQEHHEAELEGVDLASQSWFNTIDVTDWEVRRPKPRKQGDPIRIGRHSRDHITKWPNMASQLREAYPQTEDIEVHVMGGDKAVRQILGSVPPNWVSYPFGAMSAADFLAGLDVYVYFIDDNYIEAFGRAPLEALASGIPCILPPSFAELFGEGAIYCAPHEIKDHVRRLMADPLYYAERVEAGKQVVRERFSPEALLCRVAEVGVKAVAPPSSPVLERSPEPCPTQ